MANNNIHLTESSIFYSGLGQIHNLKAAMDESIICNNRSRGTITTVNDRFCKISKYTRKELIGQNHRILNSGFHPKSFFKEMWKTIGKGRNLAW